MKTKTKQEERSQGKDDCTKGIPCVSTSLLYLEGYSEQYAMDQQRDAITARQERATLAKSQPL
jgi:hypothetical protein